MQNYLMKCISCKVIILCLVLMAAKTVSPSQKDQELSRAKRNFLSREHDYLKSRPISDDLKSFIKRLKRRSWGFLGKIKRQDELKDHMFVVNNGNIEPLENMSDVTVNLPASNPSGLGNFTVIPLVIPITIKTFTNATFGDNVTEEDNSSTESLRKAEKIGKGAKLIDEEETETPQKHEKAKKGEEPQQTNGEATKEKGPTAKDSEPTTEIIIGNALSTMKSDNMKFLNKVLTDVQELISFEKGGKASGNNEGAMCSVIGDWDSNAGGIQFQITAKNESLLHPTVEIAPQDPEVSEGFLKVGAWNVTALMPFNHSSFIMMTGISDNSVASFIGECRICEGAETITGNWLLARRSTNCKDRHETSSFLSEVMRKSNIRRLHQEHLDELSTKNLITTTEI